MHWWALVGKARFATHTNDSSRLRRVPCVWLIFFDQTKLLNNLITIQQTIKNKQQHSCTSCVERELSRRKTFPCPICETLVKRVTLSTRTLDDVQCEKDTSWRRRILKVWVDGMFVAGALGICVLSVSWADIMYWKRRSLITSNVVLVNKVTTKLKRISQLSWNTTTIWKKWRI